MKTTKLRRASGQVAFLAASIAMALNANAEEPVVELDAVDIWATEIKSSSVNLDNETIASKQADHVSDLLRVIPGVDVGGAHSLNQRITMRSMDDKDLRISIDGANQNTYMYHHMGNLQINADILEEADIQVGNNSVLDGGLGGSVKFTTKSAQDLLQDGKNFGGNVKAYYGDNSSKGISASLYGRVSENADVLIYHNEVDRKDYEVGGGVIKDADGNAVEGTDGHVRGLAGNLSDTLVKVGVDLNDNHRFEIGYEAYRDEGDYTYRPDMGLATDLAIYNSLGGPLLWPTKFNRDTLTLNYEGYVGDHTSITGTLFRNVSELERDENGWAEVGWDDYAGIITGEATNTGLNVLAETEVGKHTVSYGGEVIRNDTDYHAALPTPESSSESATQSALFVQDRYQVTDKLAVTPGIRYNQYKIDSTVVDKTYSKATGALAAEYQATPNLQLKASATQLFKGPEIGEVYVGAGLYDTPNQDIEAETGLNSQIGVAYEKTLANAAKFKVGTTLFQTDLNDYIYDYAANPDGGYWKDNVGDMTVRGFESYLGYDVGNLTTLLTYSKAKSDLEAFDDYAELDGNSLDRTQGDTVTFQVGYNFQKTGVKLNWETMHVSGLDDTTYLDGATLNTAKDNFTVHNVSATWKPKSVKGLELTLGVDNLFDEFYASQSSRTGVSFHPRFGELYLTDYEPGRNVKLTATYNF